MLKTAPDMEVIADTSDGGEAAMLATQVRPDIAINHISEKGQNEDDSAAAAPDPSQLPARQTLLV